MSKSHFWFASLLALLVATPALADECHDCHKSREFKVTNKKIYDYNLDFEVSIHGVAELACTDCHGGDEGTTDMDQVHQGVMEPVHFDNIPATCGECHGEQYEAFVTSSHYQLLKKNGSAPNCVTCHGAMDMDFIFASRVRNTCQFCHNYESGTLPAIPDQADFILSKINIINGYKGYVELHAKDRELVQDLATAYADLTAKWHRFDLDEVEEDTRELLGNYRTAKAQAVKDRKSKIKR
jgi:hypothetical protein